MAFTDIETQVKQTVLLQWWQSSRRENRLCLRLLSESPENLMTLPYLTIIIKKLEQIRIQTLRDEYPKLVKEARSYLLSCQHHFLNCLRALQQKDSVSATLHYNLAHNDLTLLRYILIEQGAGTWLS